MTAEHDDIRLVEAELAAREPIFHRSEFGTTRHDFEGMMAAEFREVGASGRTYEREVILDTLEQRHREPVSEHMEYPISAAGRSRRIITWRRTCSTRMAA